MNKQHKTIMFDIEIASKSTLFVITMEVDTKIQLTINCKPTDQQTHLHTKSEHLQSLEDSVRCGRSSVSENNLFNVKRIWNTLPTLTNKFRESGYFVLLMKEQVTQVNNMNRKDLGKLKVNRMQLAVTYHRTLPSMSKNISKNWPSYK